MAKLRKIPATMVSQHPDHASVPYWHTHEFIKAQDETRELYLSFSELNVDEYKWDWEGKLVDESVMERVLGEHYEYFIENPLGEEKFLTFRLPNPNVETEFRLGRAFMGILSAATLAKQVGFKRPPMFEVILPMTETAEDMIAIQEAFSEMASLKHPLFRFDENALKNIEIIPLFEEVKIEINSNLILEEYIKLHHKKFGNVPHYIRPYLARSDPALNAGLVPTILAIKIALSRYRQFEQKTGIKLYPIIGSASVPFRGGLTPNRTMEFIEEYSGVRTALLQSAFRYDYKKMEVIESVKILSENLPKRVAKIISKDEEKSLIEIMDLFEALYKDSIEKIAPIINEIAHFLPKRRERVQHVGLFGYSRGVGKVKLPRAIGFTAALYSLGVPPELIATGRGIKKLKFKNEKLKILEKYYLNLRNDLLRAGGFLNKANLKRLTKLNPAWKKIEEDVKEIENYLGVSLGPETEEEKEHYKVATKILQKLQKKESLTKLITEAALLRKFLG